MNQPEETSEITENSVRKKLKQIRISDFYLVPNILTVSRVLAIPLLIAFLYYSMIIWALVVFIGLGISDWMDGWVARNFQSESKLGMLLDPLADKLIILSVMIMLMWLGRLDPVYFEHEHSSLISPLLVMVTVGREMGITGLRAIASSVGITMPADRGGKIKTALQFVSIALLLYGAHWALWAGQIILTISVIAALWSGFRYVFKFIKGLPA